MKDKINIAELLKDCPKGMELDCTMYDCVEFMEVDTESDTIILRVGNKFIRRLNKYGQEDNVDYAKCVIFPKGKTTWEGFVPPFKDGDIVTSLSQNKVQGIGIFDYEKQSEAWIHACINFKNEFYTDGYLGYIYDLCPATEEEKQKLFQAIKDNGYKWNPETKTLEKLIEPKFKVGDRIKKAKDDISGIITSISDDGDYKVEYKGGGVSYVSSVYQDEWELVSNKFDITTLKPFDKVLVRDNDKQKWTIDLLSFIDDEETYTFICIGHYADQCIPYEENEHLLGTTNDCDEYYKTWED